MRAKHPPCRLRRTIADPACDERRVAPLAERLDERLGGLGAGGHGGGAIEGQHGVDARVRNQGRERLGIAATGGIADDVHRVVMGPGGWQRRVQPLHRLGCELSQDPTLINQVVGREDGEAAAIAQDGHARSLRSRGHRQDLHRIEELIEAVDTQHPGAPERGFVDRIGPGHRARVRGSGARALCVATRLDDDGGFHLGRGPGRGHELAGLGHRLDVEQDGAGLGIAREVVE